MFSTTSEYALRALTHLASMPWGSAMLGQQLSKDTGVPANYLAKILLSLRNAGLVAAARGSGGGYWLLRPPDAIHLIDVVELFDGAAVKRGCLLGNGKCSDEKAAPCSAHGSWKHVQAAYTEFLEKTTVADISEVPKPAKSKANRAAARA